MTKYLFLPWIKTSLLFVISEPKTCWWTNTKRGSREDHLLAIKRTWMRKERKYLYNVIIGRLNLGIIYG